MWGIMEKGLLREYLLGFYRGRVERGNACIMTGHMLGLQGLGFRVQGGYIDYTLICYGLTPGSQLESFKLRGWAGGFCEALSRLQVIYSLDLRI